MIVGEFNARGQPYVKCRMVLPRLDVFYEVDFLVDTGAYKTCLHSRDAERMSIPFHLLRNRAESFGVGGSSSYFSENAYLGFEDGWLTRIYEVELLISDPRGAGNYPSLPSLLGRDIINYWDMRYAPMRDRLEFDVLYADYTLEDA